MIGRRRVVDEEGIRRRDGEGGRGGGDGPLKDRCTSMRLVREFRAR
jgi:hypothetical protein